MVQAHLYDKEAHVSAALTITTEAVILLEAHHGGAVTWMSQEWVCIQGRRRDVMETVPAASVSFNKEVYAFPQAHLRASPGRGLPRIIREGCSGEGLGHGVEAPDL